MQAKSDTQAIASTSFCGHVLVSSAHADVLDWLGRDLVALKMEKVVESMARMMSEQLKLTPRRANLAILTRVLIFCIASQ